MDPRKYEKNTQVGYFGKIGEIFITALAALVSQNNREIMLSNVANIDPTVYKTGHLNIISMTVAICAVLDVNQYEVHDPWHTQQFYSQDNGISNEYIHRFLTG